MIGIFDSGLGGLTVAKAIQERLPQYQLLYLGDTARVPYGNRSKEIIYEFTRQGVEFLFREGCELIILACNTASALALRKIQQEYLLRAYPERRVLGVIRPLVEKAAQLAKNKRVGVLGTRGTVSSGAYVRELKALNSEIEVYQNSAPLLVPLIEEGWKKKMETRRILRYYLRPLKEKKIDALILGCTHYPILQKEIQAAMGKRCDVLDSAKIVAESLEKYLERHSELEKKLTRASAHRYCATDITSVFVQNARAFLGQRGTLEKVEI